MSGLDLSYCIASFDVDQKKGLAGQRILRLDKVVAMASY